MKFPIQNSVTLLVLLNWIFIIWKNLGAQKQTKIIKINNIVTNEK